MIYREKLNCNILEQLRALQWVESVIASYEKILEAKELIF